MIDKDPLPESETEGSTESDNARLRKVHTRAMQRYDAIAVPQIEIRAQALEARRFVTVPGAQWESSWGADWAENAPRPEVDKITKGLEKIETDYRENRLTVDFVPVGDAANADTADTLDGMHRADSYDFKSQQARDNAFQEAIRGGFGAYRLSTDYANPYDEEDDSQRVNPGIPIVDADQSVYFYGGVFYDKSDAEAAFIVQADLRSIFDDTWGEGNADSWPLETWQWQWDWYTPDLVYTAEYYEVEDVPDKMITMTQSLSKETQKFYESEIEPSEIRALTAQGWKRTTKPARRKRVHKYIMNGSRILKDCGYIAGPNIPIVPVYYRRDWINGQERFRGYVQKKMDPARIYNAKVASLLEADAIGPHETPVFDPTQIDDRMAEQWANANVERLPFLFAHALRNSDGTIASQGPSFTVKKSDVSPNTAALLQIASADLTDDNDNTDQIKANTSADAMDIAATRVDAKSGIALDNMRQSLEREGVIYEGMCRETVWEPGRKVQTLTADGQSGEATIAEPYMDENQVFRMRNDLTQGTYKVIASVQESTATKRQKTVKQYLDLAQIAVPAQAMDLAKISLLQVVKNTDGEGDADMQNWARKQLIALGVVQPTPDEKAQMEQAAAEQGQQPPSPQEQLASAAAAKDQSTAELNQAKVKQTLADAELKSAQAEAVGGPEAAPPAPSGLASPGGPVEVAEKLASADLKTAQAAHLRHGMGLATEKHALEVGKAHHGAHMAERQQDHAENPPTAPGAE